MIHKVKRLENVNGKLSFEWKPESEVTPISSADWEKVMTEVGKMKIGEEKFLDI